MAIVRCKCDLVNYTPHRYVEGACCECTPGCFCHAQEGGG